MKYPSKLQHLRIWCSSSFRIFSRRQVLLTNVPPLPTKEVVEMSPKINVSNAKCPDCRRRRVVCYGQYNWPTTQCQPCRKFNKGKNLTENDEEWLSCGQWQSKSAQKRGVSSAYLTHVGASPPRLLLPSTSLPRPEACVLSPGRDENVNLKDTALVLAHPSSDVQRALTFTGTTQALEGSNSVLSKDWEVENQYVRAWSVYP
jgi:hypothetical protein